MRPLLGSAWCGYGTRAKLSLLFQIGHDYSGIPGTTRSNCCRTMTFTQGSSSPRSGLPCCEEDKTSRIGHRRSCSVEPDIGHDPIKSFQPCGKVLT